MCYRRGMNENYPLLGHQFYCTVAGMHLSTLAEMQIISQYAPDAWRAAHAGHAYWIDSGPDYVTAVGVHTWVWELSSSRPSDQLLRVNSSNDGKYPYPDNTATHRGICVAYL
ncbi:hypothetical protein AGMMS49525_10720 [Bacteroidia bacterium]|nr:hypothetical protein AGMMS49525_10720 [Bacteroidia bacterium]